MTFYDTHAHLDYPDFASELPDVIARAEAAGISRIVCIGTDLASSASAVELAERFPGVYAAVGWHPSHASEAPEDIRPALRSLAKHPKVVAIGETGLDHHRLPSEKPECSAVDDTRYREKQARIFQQQLEVAAEFGLNCVIHQRDCFEAAIGQLKPFAGKVRGVFHCFVGTIAEMEQVLSLGSLVSFTGILTFKNGQSIRDTLAATPPDGFMLETDCPYLAPMPYRGKRCEPAHVREIATVAAQVRGCSLAELSDATCATARRFFPKMG
jgi:TatD DNase family protein